jgi:uncharacterized protein YndB with AHSA1/START domain
MAESANTPPAAVPTAGREIVNTRLIDAPRELVFRAFREPRHLAQWWGPKDFTNTFSEFDFQPGGHWRFVMHGPDGTDFPNHSVFDQIVAPEKIVFRHLDPIHEFQMTILLAEQGGKTRITWRMLHPTVEKSDQVRPFVLEANEQNFDKLEAELARMAADRPNAID